MSSHLPVLCRPAIVPILTVLFVLGRPVIYGVLCVAVCRPVERPAWVVVHQVCSVCAGDPRSPPSVSVVCRPAI